MAVPIARLGIDRSEIHHQVINLLLPSNNTYPYGYQTISHRIGHTICGLDRTYFERALLQALN